MSDFTDDELQFLNAKANGVPIVRMHSVLGWSASRVDRVRKSVSVSCGRA
jgi:hypothetical protein